MLAAHKAPLAQLAYAPKLIWKTGECEAFKTASDFFNGVAIPIFLIPPAGDFDHETKSILSPADHIRSFGTRLKKSRGSRPVFVDASYVDDDRHRIAFNVHPLTALLERARLAGAQAWPLTSYGRSDPYQEAVAKAHLRHNVPVAVQISIAELGSATLSDRLKSVCNQVSCDPNDAVLVIDGGPLALRNETDDQIFTDILIELLNNLPSVYEWNQIVFSATSLSDPQKIKVGEQKIIRRSEWHIHRQLVLRKTELYRQPIFSDYGVEFRSKLVPTKARPTAKFNYTTDNDHFYAKGQNVKHGGYQAIFSVAETVVDSGYFKGEAFSKGDARIFALSKRACTTGGAPSWRWASLDHHFSMIEPHLREERGIASDTNVDLSVEFEQTELFPLIPAR